VPAVSSPAGLNLANLKELGPMTDVSERDAQRVRASKNQSLFREVNERIEDLAGDASFSTFVCECMNEACDESVALTVEEYEHIRADSNRFFVRPGHDVPDVEVVVEETERYAVVAKLGAGQPVAERLDPRNRRSSR
jgi:hypothetical protein